MPDISQALRIEGPEPKARKEDAGVCVEYMGVRVIIAPRMLRRGDKGVWVLVTHDHPDGIVDYELQGDEAEEDDPCAIS
jgi:hypothetical protein